MAKGEVAVKALIKSGTFLTTTAVSRLPNPANTITQITQITLCNTGTSERTVTMYIGGTSAAFTYAIVKLAPLSMIDSKDVGAIIGMPGHGIVLEGNDYLAAKQDAGSDVAIYASGIQVGV